MKMKTVLVTGANRGISFYTAKRLAKNGARIVMACRDLSKSIPVYEAIRMETGHSEIEVMYMDLASHSDAKSSGSLARGKILGSEHPVISFMNCIHSCVIWKKII